MLNNLNYVHQSVINLSEKSESDDMTIDEDEKKL